MQIGLLGLGKMGRALAEKLMEDNHQVVLWNRTKETLDAYRSEKAELVVSGKLQICRSIEEVRTNLIEPRVFWSMVPAGEATEKVLQEVKEIAQAGDIIVDGGNANFKDTERRYKEFQEKGMKFVGLGVSGGIHAIENGFCLMGGGDIEGYNHLKMAFDSLIKPYGAHGYFGTGGAGHFVKMVHNGIEYGMMQAIAEGFGVLQKSEYNFNLIDIANTYLQGSIIGSFLMEITMEALEKDSTLSRFDGTINATGEGKWTVEQAHDEHVPAPVLEQAYEFRAKSLYDKAVQETFAAKLVAAMRTEFGGHAPTAPKAPPTEQK